MRPSEVNATPASGSADKTSIFQFPHLWLGVLCLFVYVGVEVMAGDAIGTHGHGFDLPLDRTKIFTSFTLGAMLAGYIAGLVLIPRVVSQARYLSISAVLGVVFSIGAYLTHGYVSVAFVAALGFANAMMWPAIFPLAIQGLGRFTEIGSALLIMGIAGGAIIPQAFAVLKQHYDFQLVFAALMVPVTCTSCSTRCAAAGPGWRQARVAEQRRPEPRIMDALATAPEQPMRRPTIKDVAERAKVSLKTVSRVINNEPSVMQATRARVLRAIADLDYEPDPSARNLRSGTRS